jgi:hypothetical protein
MALSVLAKGLIGIVLPGAVLVLYTLFSRDRAIWKRLHMGIGLLVFFAIAAPWFVLVSLKNPEFARFFFIHEHFQRFTSHVHHREGNWYYFIPLLILGITPWLGVLPQSLWNGRRDTASGFEPKKVLLIWSAFIFFFFSISGSKLPGYILPIFPALALLIACYLQDASYKAIAFASGLFALASAAGLLMSARIPKLAGDAFELPLFQAYLPWVAGAAAIGLVSGLFAVWLARRQREMALVCLAAGGFLMTLAILIGHEPLGRYKAGALHVPAIEAELTPHTPIYAVSRYEQSLPFYLGRTMTLVENPDEMEFGLKQEPQLWLPTVNAFVSAWATHQAKGEKALAIIRPDVFKDLQKKGLPMRVVSEDPRRVIVASDVKK